MTFNLSTIQPFNFSTFQLLYEPRGKRRFGRRRRARHARGDDLERDGDRGAASFHLPRVGAAAHRCGLRPAAHTTCREAGGRRGGEVDGALAQACGERALLEGGKRGLLREVGGRAPELPRQAGRIGLNHPRRTKGHRALTEPRI